MKFLKDMLSLSKRLNHKMGRHREAGTPTGCGQKGCKAVVKGAPDPVSNQSKLEQEDRELSAQKKKKVHIHNNVSTKY